MCCIRVSLLRYHVSYHLLCYETKSRIKYFKTYYLFHITHLVSIYDGYNYYCIGYICSLISFVTYVKYLYLKIQIHMKRRINVNAACLSSLNTMSFKVTLCIVIVHFYIIVFRSILYLKILCSN
jgi:hypothetical protein